MAVQNPVYLYDIAVVNVLIAVSIVAWLALYRRLPRLRKFRFAFPAAILISAAAVLLLHIWAEFRPIPVLVYTSRPMTEKEKASLISRGQASAELLKDMRVSESTTFLGTNAGNWTWTEVRQLRHLLAWHGILPALPKRIEIPAEDPGFAHAYYSWTGRRQRSIGFVNWNGRWRIQGEHSASASGTDPTNLWHRAVSRIPIDFNNY